ncbi:MAG TPA: hypothetical protein VN709_00530 [Terriglobales bacterium]|nr:hypothetical protein [Terriglobales bacterium]
MKLRLTLLSLLLAGALLGFRPATPNFSGTWSFNPAKSANLGMMARMSDTVTIEQTETMLTTHDAASFGGAAQPPRDTHYDLTGKAVSNTSPTGEAGETTSRWQGDRLVTTWITEGSVAGSKHERVETRYLSADGRTMYLESKPIVMAFDKR